MENLKSVAACLNEWDGEDLVPGVLQKFLTVGCKDSVAFKALSAFQRGRAILARARLCLDKLQAKATSASKLQAVVAVVFTDKVKDQQWFKQPELEDKVRDMFQLARVSSQEAVQAVPPPVPP